MTLSSFAKRIAFEDAHVLVVNKLAGQFTQEASNSTKKVRMNSLVSEARAYLVEKNAMTKNATSIHTQL